jgi:mono/diheme cytochrome c family protein
VTHILDRLALAALPLALAGCAAGNVESGATQAAVSTTGPEARPGGIVHDGAAIATMAEQYATPRRSGAAAGSGASVWVAPAPAPAFALSGPLPPGDPPAPPPAAVANRQPAEAPAPAPAAEASRPEAAAPAATAAGVDRAAGRALFNDWSCGTCHALADAGASGAIGPSLDGNARLTAQGVTAIVTHGQGAMPGFGGQMSDEEIATLAAYIVAAKR